MAPTPMSMRNKRKAEKVASSSSPTKPRSSKKSRTASDVRVEVLPNNPEYDPVVVSFPRGIPSSVDDGDGDESSSGARNAPPRFACSKLKPTSSRGRRVLGEDDKCTYSASAKGRGHDGRLTKTYVCVYDRRKKTLKLIPSAEKGTVFALEQTVKGYVSNVANGSMLTGPGRTDANDGGGESTAKVMSASDTVQMLVESFGSRKKQKVMASRAANKVNIHSVVGAGDVLMHSVTGQEGISKQNKKGMEEGGEGIVDLNEVAYEAARRKMLPPYDAGADKPSKVYNAQTIAGTTAWDKVSRIVDKVLAKAEGDDDADLAFSLLGRNRPPSIVALLSSIDPSKKGSPYRIKVAFLLALAMKFYGKVQNRGFIEGASLDDCISAVAVPHEVGARLFALFASPVDGRDDGGYAVSKQQKSKMRAYILILYVIANGSSMKVGSIDQLCKDIKLDTKDASLVLRESGFTVKSNRGEGGVGVSLAVPLKFPPPKRGKRT